jgi:transposase
MEDVEDEPLFAERVAGIDIAKAGAQVTIRVPSDTHPGRRQQETRSFGMTHKQLLARAAQGRPVNRTTGCYRSSED